MSARCNSKANGLPGKPTHELGYGIRNPGARSVLQSHRWRLSGRDAQHAGDAGAQDVSIHQPDARTALLQRERQIDAHCGFSDAAFAAADRDDVPDSGKFLGAGRRLE